MKIALVQTEIVWENKEKNLEKAMKIIAELSKTDVNLILFPEMSFTGFSMNTAVTKENDGYTINRLSLIARNNNTSIGFGWVKDVGKKCENHYTIVNQNGKVISDYVKIHPFSYSGEDKKFIGGTNIVRYRIDDIWFSTFICYDLRFPEIFQAVSDDVSAIIVPANWPEDRKKHWKCLLRARAIENQVYILAVNCVGEMHDIKYSGDSCIIDPDGNIIDERSHEEGVLFFSFDDDTKKFRDSFQMRRDRQPELYYRLRIK